MCIRDRTCASSANGLAKKELARTPRLELPARAASPGVLRPPRTPDWHFRRAGGASREGV
eukprot:6772569-Alexandrium_andersonii.AAC.2